MSWPADPCPTCPHHAAWREGACRAQTSGHRRFCELADPGHPAYREEYEDLLAGRVRSPDVPADIPAPAEDAPPAPPRDFRRDRLILARARGCLYRDPCGCNAATCHAGRGPGGSPRVYLSDCVACIGGMTG